MAQTTTPVDSGIFTRYENDPLNVHKTVLKNGLTVLLSPNTREPRIQTMIAIRAGSKNDPADNTGLAHYLEHMLFKGSEKFGTKNYELEKVYLDKIEAYYEAYKAAPNPELKARFYYAIDSVSLIASRLAIANEYDKIVSALGAKGTNAFTSFDETVYINDIPKNSLLPWLMLEQERFRAPVFRLFHTELESVYEEKNMSLDDDESQAFEALMRNIFIAHPYGTQSTIGTIEHLKNPSLRAIRDFYRRYYVPSNMALIMSGDFDPAEIMPLIESTLGQWNPRPEVSQPVFGKNIPLPQTRMVEVTGPDAEFFMMGYLMPAMRDKDATKLWMCDAILSNSVTGLIDLNLNKKQKVQSAYAQPLFMADYSASIFVGKPREGQTLEEVRDLILAEIENLKSGNFDHEILKAIIANEEKDLDNRRRSNYSRANELRQAFIKQIPWDQYTNRLEYARSLTVDSLTAFAQKYFTIDRAEVFKRSGEVTGREKIEKPKITPIELNKDAESEFAKGIMTYSTPAIEPQFVDLQNAAYASSVNNLPMLSIQQPDSRNFNLRFVWEMGRLQKPELKLLEKALSLANAGDIDAESFNRKMYSLACSYNLQVRDNETILSLSGLDKNLPEALALLDKLITQNSLNDDIFGAFIATVKKEREDLKKNKSAIFQRLRAYATYGPKNPQNRVLTNTQLDALSAMVTSNEIKNLAQAPRRIEYFGPRDAKELNKTLVSASLCKPGKAKLPKRTAYKAKSSKKAVFTAHYDMVQAEIGWVRNVGKFKPEEDPEVQVFNEYFGAGMNSVVFQEIREARALAYSSYASYILPSFAGEPALMLAYVGTQADKLTQAIPAMNDLINNLEVKPRPVANAGKSIRAKIASERVLDEQIFEYLMRNKKLGYKADPRIEIYNRATSIDKEAVDKFRKAKFVGKPFTLAVLGNSETLDKEFLAKYGKLNPVTLEQLFGY